MKNSVIKVNNNKKDNIEKKNELKILKQNKENNNILEYKIKNIKKAFEKKSKNKINKNINHKSKI